MIGHSTNTLEFVSFLRQLRGKIDTSDGRLETHIVLDNHSAHRALPVSEYIKQDTQATGHRFIMTFQPPYSCQFNVQETVWALVKRRFRISSASLTQDLTAVQFAAAV